MDGEGARVNGGRWNSVGVGIVYTAGSISLAILELLVHFNAPDILTQNYVIIPIEFEDTLLKAQQIRDLPNDWQASPAPVTTQQIGNQWVSSASSAVLQVPSAIVPEEVNYLINPLHPDFGKIIVGRPERLHLDPRLIK